jgi:hypothetical protein
MRNFLVYFEVTLHSQILKPAEDKPFEKGNTFKSGHFAFQNSCPRFSMFSIFLRTKYHRKKPIKKILVSCYAE